jgi:hypothetical protein
MPLDVLSGYLSDTEQDTLRWILEHTSQALIAAEAAAAVEAQTHERTESRVGHRNGHRQRKVDTRVAGLELEIPKLRQGIDVTPLKYARSCGLRNGVQSGAFCRVSLDLAGGSSGRCGW